MKATHEYQGIDITKHHNTKWTITGDEHPTFKRLSEVKRYIDDLGKQETPPEPEAKKEPAPKTGKGTKHSQKGTKKAKQQEPVEQEPQEDAEARFDVRMTTGTPVLGNATAQEVALFLAKRLAQSNTSKPLKQFQVQPLELREDAEHSADLAQPAITADDFAAEHITDEIREQAKEALKNEASTKASKRKTVRKLTSLKPNKPAAKSKQPPVGERFADEQLVNKSGKITYGMVRQIREETAQFFEPGGPKGKVAAYRRLAKELGLGMETVAKISRYNILEDVE